MTNWMRFVRSPNREQCRALLDHVAELVGGARKDNVVTGAKLGPFRAERDSTAERDVQVGRAAEIATIEAQRKKRGHSD